MTVLARADGVLGELVLRRAGAGDAVELISNGVFLMDSGDTSTERLLATRALAALAGDGWHVVVGGLGLGFTAAAALEDPRVATVTVVEIEPALLEWCRRGLLPGLASRLDDDRLHLLAGDVAQVVPALPHAATDAVLLDVDNGPGFLVHPDNAPLYSRPFLAAVAGRLRPGGALAVWSADSSPALVEALEDAVGTCTQERLVVTRDGRELDYWLYVARRGVPSTRGVRAAYSS